MIKKRKKNQSLRISTRRNKTEIVVDASLVGLGAISTQKTVQPDGSIDLFTCQKRGLDRASKSGKFCEGKPKHDPRSQ